MRYSQPTTNYAVQVNTRSCWSSKILSSYSYRVTSDLQYPDRPCALPVHLFVCSPTCTHFYNSGVNIKLPYISPRVTLYSISSFSSSSYKVAIDREYLARLRLADISLCVIALLRLIALYNSYIWDTSISGYRSLLVVSGIRFRLGLKELNQQIKLSKEFWGGLCWLVSLCQNTCGSFFCVP